MAVTLNRLSRELVFWLLESPDSLAGIPVEVAFMDDPLAFPETGDWVTADLVEPEHPTLGNGEDYFAVLLIGPGGEVTTLTPGDYQTWVRWTGATEIPVRRSDVLTIE